jgi:hypothetical protein
MVPLVVTIAMVAFVVWLGTLVSHLRSTHMNQADKICWTVVLCTLNLLGLAIYFFLAPKAPENECLKSEAEIKEAANEGRLRKW